MRIKWFESASLRNSLMLRKPSRSLVWWNIFSRVAIKFPTSSGFIIQLTVTVTPLATLESSICDYTCCELVSEQIVKVWLHAVFGTRDVRQNLYVSARPAHVASATYHICSIRYKDAQAFGTSMSMSIRDERREAAIERMADHLLLEGLGAATLRPLAAAAGTSDRMLLYYFSDKDELLSATLQRLAARMTAQLDEAVPIGRLRS